MSNVPEFLHPIIADQLALDLETDHVVDNSRKERLGEIKIERGWNTSNDKTFQRLLFLLYLKRFTDPIKNSKFYSGIKHGLLGLKNAIFISNSEKW